MISDRDIWAAALLMVKRYGADAAEEATKRADAHTYCGLQRPRSFLNGIESALAVILY